MKVKANILAAFVAKKSKEAKEKVAEKVAEIRDEL
jgi:hypothetical protein